MLDCPQFTVKRAKYFNVLSLKDLFYDVSARVIVDFQRYWILQSFVILYFSIFNLSISNLYFIVAKIALIITVHFYLSYSYFYDHFSLF